MAALLLAAAGCSRGAEARPPSLPPGAPLAAPPACPAVLEGARVTLEEVQGVLGLRFTTTEEEVDELRRRVAAMAEQHNRMLESPALAGRRVAGVPPPSHAEVEEVQGGARLVLRPPGDGAARLLGDRDDRLERRLAAPCAPAWGSH